MSTVAVIQARMSSRRFPGKVLAPFRGRPLITHVVSQLRAVLGLEIVLATSTEPSDDPLACYAATLDVRVVRGALDDVRGRFLTVGAATGAARMLRICADSPLLSRAALEAVVAAGERVPEADLVTTTLERSYPKGQNAELIRTAALRELPEAELEPADREHVTRYFHRHAVRFRIVSVASHDPSLAAVELAVDTLDDLARLEQLTDTELASYEARATRSAA